MNLLRNFPHIRSVASGHYDRKVRFWDTRLNEPVRVVELANKVTSLVLSLGKSIFCFILNWL
ncbi:hypothetical protein WUBG_08974 [Wuchereria bancrofti]|uniref:WD_REPEATS_REGION domain-containing protein n=1 Tax=Wuchereria bancrofti TaxID=6293 RepID=J9EY87_WUCBA|nr:hypothetical protein WUBG_08974 [Wuchereria bancrofti]